MTPRAIFDSARYVLTLAAALVLIACDDGDVTGVTPPGSEPVAVVVNSIDISVTVFPVDRPADARTIGLAPAGSPVSLAARGGLVVVPMGLLPTAAVLDLSAPNPTVRTIALPENSGATGVAFWDATTAYVANPNLDTVSRLKLDMDTADLEIPVGRYPQAIVASENRLWVLTAQLDESFQPARPGRISVVDPVANVVLDTVVLSGLNPAAAAFGPDGLLYVLNSGTFGSDNGSLSVVDPAGPDEVEHHTGFGEFPGGLAVDDDGRAFVSSFAYGVAIWDASADSFLHPPSDPLPLNGATGVSGVAIDSSGRLYSLSPGDCTAPGSVLRTNPDDLAVSREIGVGICPIALAITDVGDGSAGLRR